MDGRPELTPEDQKIVGEMLTTVARIIAAGNPSLIEGNPIMLTMPLELSNTELAVAMQIKRRGRVTGLFTPDGREILN